MYCTRTSESASGGRGVLELVDRMHAGPVSWVSSYIQKQ
jgi:hypothetical protein